MMTTVTARDGFFCLILTRIMDYFSCSPPNASFYIEKKRLPETLEYAEMRHGDVILTLYDVTDPCAASVRPTCGCSFFYSFPLAGWDMRDKQIPSLVSSGDRNIPTIGATIPVGNEACRVSHLNFPLNGVPKG